MDDFDWLQIDKEGARAFGRAEDGGFRVRAGSTAVLEGSPRVKRDRALREQLRTEGVLVPDENPELLRFTADHVFSSASTAAGVVIDGNSNGSIWRSSEGERLPPFSRADIEGAMDAYDRYRQDGDGAEIFDAFGSPQQYWVRSTRDRPNRLYPTKPIVGFLIRSASLSGGWGQRGDAASRLHNSGFIIVAEDDQPIRPPERYPHLIRDADLIRLFALNYYLEPARDGGGTSVTIRAGTLHDELGLEQAWANVCQALEGRQFQDLAKVPPPQIAGPSKSTTTTFTYALRKSEARSPMTTLSPTAPTNLILYGPPGTGKTYETALEAVKLCLGEGVAEQLKGDRKALMTAYNELVAAERVEFVTFHQSFAYEDFVEGLRPTTESNNENGSAAGAFSLMPHDGVFKRISERARLDTGQSVERPLDRSRSVYKIALGRRGGEIERIRDGLDNNIIHLGWGGDVDWSDDRFSEPGEILKEWREKKDVQVTGKDANVEIMQAFRAAMEVGDYVIVSDGRDRFQALGRVVGDYAFDPTRLFHPHIRPVEWLWQSEEGLPREQFYPKFFRQHSLYQLDRNAIDWDALESALFNVDAERPLEGARPHVLIIDEINRANISKVFGELITLLEADKRLGCENEIRLKLPYSGTSFGVPANLHIIGTMNTADRSIALLDTALRRRFSFRELMPQPNKLGSNVGGINLQKFLAVINERIEYLFDREHQIGHAYFTGCKTAADVDAVVRNKIIPLLNEYFYEDWSKVAAVLGDRALASKTYFLEARQLQFPGAAESDDFGTEKLRWSVKQEFDFSEFAA